MLPYNAGAFLHNKRLLKQLKSLRFCFILFKKILFVIIIFIDKLVLFVKIIFTALEKSRAKTIIVICHSANSVSKNCNTHQNLEN